MTGAKMVQIECSIKMLQEFKFRYSFSSLVFSSGFLVIGLGSPKEMPIFNSC